MSDRPAPAYEAAGVNLAAADEIVRRFKPLAARTATPQVESGLGSFGGFYAYPSAGSEHLLVASIDGVGTKMKVARLTGQWQGAGFDIVAHCVDDILTHGARPLFFLDYIGAARLDLKALEALGEGMAEACCEAGCALLGGETAEMPGVYLEGEVDLVGCIIGGVARDDLLPGDRVQVGDVLIGLASQGLHTNGYSLARRALLENGPGLDGSLPGGVSVGEALSARHRMYWKAVLPYLGRAELHGMAHITGGGLPGNVVRILPQGCSARITLGSWEVPPLFQEIQRIGRVSEDEMYQVFNMGVGWVMVVDASVAEAWCHELDKAAWGPAVIGRVERGGDGVEMAP